MELRRREQHSPVLVDPYGRVTSLESPDHGLSLRVVETASESVLVASGEVDMLSGADFRAAIEEQARTAPVALRVDLRGVDSFGSEGIQALVRARHMAGERGVTVTTSASPIVARVLEVTGLTGLVEPADGR